MPEPTLIRAVLDLGYAGLLVIAIWAFASRKVRTSGEIVDIEARHAAERTAAKLESDSRLAEMRGDRDEWKVIATTAVSKVERLTDVLETLTRKPT